MDNKRNSLSGARKKYFLGKFYRCDQPIDSIHFNLINAWERKYDNYPSRLTNDKKCLYLISAEFYH